MPPRDQQTQGQGRGQEQPGRTPEPAPEYCSHDYRERRQPRGVTIKVWFHQLSHDDVEQDEHTHGAHRQRPSRIDGEGKDGGKERGYSHTHVGYEAHHACQNSAKQGLREAQHAQAYPDGQPESRG